MVIPITNPQEVIYMADLILGLEGLTPRITTERSKRRLVDLSSNTKD